MRRSLLSVYKLPLLIRHLGWHGARAYIKHRLKGMVRGQPYSPPPSKNNVCDFYDFITRPAEAITSPLTESLPERTINWVIPHFNIGSGGHMTIFRFLQQLEQRGYHCRIIIVEPTVHIDAKQARQLIRKHFIPVQAEVIIGEASLKPAEFTIATSWETAYAVRRFQATRYKLYFVQDMEPDFHAHGSTYAFAEATYRFGFIGITAGDWLAQNMLEHYGMLAYPFGFSYDKAHYRPKITHHTQQSRRVFFYARPVTPRRGFELGLLVLNAVAQALPEVEFVLVGWETGMYHIPFKHISSGVVSTTELPKYYQMCDAALVLSLTNLSLLPLELMACGCPVVSNDGANVEWQLKHEHNALLAPATPEDLAAGIIRLLTDENLRQRMIKNGLAFAQATDWDQEGDKVSGYLEQIRSTACGV